MTKKEIHDLQVELNRWTKKDGDCWLWTGYVMPNGYGKTGDQRYAHRVAYEAAIGPIPEGLQIDHLCRVRHCVNPAHLEAVTQQENLARGERPGRHNREKQACKRGHPFVESNTYWRGTSRECRACWRERRKERA